MKTRLFALLASLACVSSAAFAAALPDYIRYAEDKQSARLEVAIKSFTLPSGQTVDLIGVVHIADAAYYRQLNQRLATYDSVLYELVGDPEALTRSAGKTDAAGEYQSDNALSSIQQNLGKYLNLSFQLGAIDYSRKNMVHADATQEEFAKMQQERGENTLNLLARAMDAQMRSEANRTAIQELNTFALIRILLSEDSASEFKRALAKTMDQFEAVTADIEGKQGTAIVRGRNEVVMGKLKEVLANRKQHRIAVFYGGAHMPGIEAMVLSELQAKASGEEWLAAWTMPTKPPAPKSAAPKPPAAQDTARG